MAAVSRLPSLTNKTSLHNLINRHLLRPSAAAAAANSFNISPESQTLVHFTDNNNKLSFSTANELVLNWKFPIGVVSALPAFDLPLMELRGGSRSTSSNKSKYSSDLEEEIDDDDDDDDDVYGSYNDSDSDNDNDDEDDGDYGRRGGGGRGRGGGAYAV